MKKFWKCLAACAMVSCLAVTFTGCNVSEANTDYLSSFVDTTVAYNEIYTLKAKSDNGEMLTYSVKNAAGSDVFVYNYTFAVTEMTVYTVTVTAGNKSKSYKLTPKDMSVPSLEIKRDIQRINVLKDEKVYYPEIIVSDNADAEVTVTYSVSYNGKNYESESDGFIPTELGFYTLTISAEDDENNVAIKTVVYESVETVEETYKVFAFDEDATRYFDYVGLQYDKEPVLSYNTDEQYIYGDEKGSTRMHFIATGTPLFVVKNQMIDTAEFDYIRFYVYNASDVSIGLGVNITEGMYTLEPGVWTEIIIDSWECERTPGMDHSDITGMPFMFWKGSSAEERFGYKGDLYFSAAYGVKE